MRFTVPIYINELRPDGALSPVYVVRPLFFEHPQWRGENISRVVTRFTRELKRLMERQAAQTDQLDLSRWSFCPEVDDHPMHLTINLGDHHIKVKLLLTTFEALGRRLAFVPVLPDIAFEAPRNESLYDRAVDVLTGYLRDQIKRHGPGAVNVAALSLQGKAWTTTVDFDLDVPILARAPKPSFFLSLGDAEQVSGSEELNRVGRSLTALYPDELERASSREREVGEVARLLESNDNRPVLLVGPRLSGKTAIVHEYVFRRTRELSTTRANKRDVWLIAPQRLISGMSYVGQWENRLLAILKVARKREHVLYFDDLLGLYLAGQSACSSLSVADVLKPFVERRKVRVLAEITPESLAVLRERDRGFADQFQIVRVDETSEDATFRILIALTRRFEFVNRCAFDLDALPTIVDLQRRYRRDAAFPGKAAVFLQRLAVKHKDAQVSRLSVLQEFQAQSGMSVDFLDRSSVLDRAAVVASIADEVIGQDLAVATVADIVCLAKARLNDPDRPLASLLFLGPTGVGKTQCAKALARYLFGDVDKLIRFDMNEFLTPSSVARLVGTFHNPEGLLTAAVRRQPFSVVLLDEIEKAHRDVFDLLLQVMGDGRLTDALGRTVDFTNVILIMTSNLGVREATRSLGFRQNETAEAHAYRHVAEQFFRPEFFNRLDRVVPFERLRREDVRGIADRLIREVFAREGLVRRKCVLHVDPGALERIVDRGYHPHLGARALKRAVENQLTQPIGACLAELTPDAPAVVGLYLGGGGVATRVDGLRCVERMPAIQRPDISAVVDSIERTMDALDEGLSDMQPSGAFAFEDVDLERLRYFFARDQIKRVRKLAASVAARTSGKPPSSRREEPVVRGRSGRSKWRPLVAPDTYDNILAVPDLANTLRAMAALAATEDASVADHLADVLREAALARTLSGDAEEDTVHRAILCLHSPGICAPATLGGVRDGYRRLFEGQFNMQVRELPRPREGWLDNFAVLSLDGIAAWTLARAEQGTHVFCSETTGAIELVQVVVAAVGYDADPAAVCAALLDARRRWLDALSRGETSADGDPFALGPVIRVHAGSHGTLDLRSALMSAASPTIHDARAFLLASLGGEAQP